LGVRQVRTQGHTELTGTTIKPTLENVKSKKDQMIVSRISTPIIAEGPAGRPFSRQSDGAIVSTASRTKHRVCAEAIGRAAVASRRIKRDTTVGLVHRREAWRPVRDEAIGALRTNADQVGSAASGAVTHAGGRADVV
jgi:hypothetical protein